MFNELDRLRIQFLKDCEDFNNKMKKRSVSMTAKTMQFVLVYQDEDRCKTCFFNYNSLLKKMKELGLFKKRWTYYHRSYDRLKMSWIQYDKKFSDVMDNMTFEYSPFQAESLTAFTDGAKIFRIT
tara:strand:+ start:1448 stop:1822 length:375 start_codon:yes stop_codon:yes gene_type:complete